VIQQTGFRHVSLQRPLVVLNDTILDVTQPIVEVLVLLTCIVYYADAVFDRGVASSTKVFSNVGERGISEFSRKPYGHMARLHEFLVTLAADEVLVGNVVIGLYYLLYLFDGHLTSAVGPLLLCDLHDVLVRECAVSRLALGGDDKALLTEPFDDTYVRAGSLGHEAEIVIADGSGWSDDVFRFCVLHHPLTERTDEKIFQLVAWYLD